MTRQDNAYYIPAAIFLGIAINTGTSIAHLLIKKAKNRGMVWMLSLSTLVFITLFIFSQFLKVDFYASPYIVSSWYPGFLAACDFLLTYFCYIGVTITLMYNTVWYYKKDRTVIIGMYILAFFVLAIKGADTGFGLAMSVDLFNNKYLAIENHPLYQTTKTVYAIGTVANLVFTTLGCFGCLLAMTNDQVNESGRFSRALIKNDGHRFVIVPLIYTFIAAFALYGIIRDHTYITNVGTYLHPWAVSLELLALLDQPLIKLSQEEENFFKMTLETSPKRSPPKIPFASVTGSGSNDSDMSVTIPKYYNQPKTQKTAKPYTLKRTGSSVPSAEIIL